MTVHEALSQATTLLKTAGIQEPRLEAEILLAHACQRDRLWLHIHGRQGLPLGPLAEYFRLVEERRRRRVPIHYLTGKREFWSMEFHVGAHTLIPRPETETLVESALGILERERWVSPWILDLGTGSGCIVLALLKELPRAMAVATDIDPLSLETAKKNALSHGLQNRLFLLAADWLSAFSPGTPPFDLVVSNPPYVAEPDAGRLAPEVAGHEPRVALFAGPDGMCHIRRLLAEVPRVLKPGGWFVCEIGWDQGKEAEKAAGATALYRHVSIIKDLAGNDRVLAGKTR